MRKNNHAAASGTKKCQNKGATKVKKRQKRLAKQDNEVQNVSRRGLARPDRATKIVSSLRGEQNVR